MRFMICHDLRQWPGDELQLLIFMGLCLRLFSIVKVKLIGKMCVILVISSWGVQLDFFGALKLSSLSDRPAFTLDIELVDIKLMEPTFDMY